MALIVFYCKDFDSYIGGNIQTATLLAVLMKVYTIPCHESGHINVVLVLQSCSDSLHILPSTSSETNAASGGVCNLSSVEVQEDVDVIEEIFISINEEVNRGVKQEEIPGDITFAYMKSEPDKVSYISMSVIGHILPIYRNFFLLCQYSWPIETAALLGIKMFCCLFLWCVGGRVCTVWVGGRVCTGWVVGGRVCTVGAGGR